MSDRDKALEHIDRAISKTLSLNPSAKPRVVVIGAHGGTYTLEEIREEISKGTEMGQKQIRIWSKSEDAIKLEQRKAAFRSRKTRL